MISCYLVADHATLLFLQGYFERYPFAQVVGLAEIDNFEEVPLYALKPQVIFVSVSLRDRLSAHISKLMQFSSVVYLSDTNEHAFAAFEDGVFDYLVMPLSYGRLERCLHKYLSLYLQQKPSAVPMSEKLERFFVRTEGKESSEILVDTKQLVWVEAYDNSVLLRMGDGTQYKCFCTVREMEEALPNHFLRIHKSFIINCHKVATINGFKIGFSGAPHRELVVGVTYRKAFLERKNEMAIRKVKPISTDKFYQHIAIWCLFLSGILQDLPLLSVEI